MNSPLLSVCISRKKTEYMGVLWEVGISPKLKLYRVFCPGGSSDAVVLQVN